jgi:hypothetical protein
MLDLIISMYFVDYESATTYPIGDDSWELQNGGGFGHCYYISEHNQTGDNSLQQFSSESEFLLCIMI